MKYLLTILAFNSLLCFSQTNENLIGDEDMTDRVLLEIEEICGEEAADMIERKEVWYAHIKNGVPRLPLYLPGGSDTIKAHVRFNISEFHSGLYAELILTKDSAWLMEDDMAITQAFNKINELDFYYDKAKSQGMSKKYTKKSADLVWYYDGKTQSLIPTIRFTWSKMDKKNIYKSKIHFHHYRIDANTGDFIEKYTYSRPRINVNF